MGSGGCGAGCLAALREWACEAVLLVANAGPLYLFNVSQFANNLLSQAFIGRLGPKELAAASLAISYMNVCCQTVNYGLATGLETVVSQANGAARFREVGIYLQRGFVVLVISQVVMNVVALFAGRILGVLGQAPELCDMAAKYILVSLPTMWGMGFSTVMCTWLQAQGIFRPVVLLSLPALGIQIALLTLLLPRVGYLGAAYATTVSSWTSAALFAAYAWWLERGRAPERRTLHGLSRAALDGLWGYIKVALPSFSMILFEWSALEVAVVLSGVLPGAQSGVPTSCSAMVMGMITLEYAWSLALSQSSSSRVGNTLGEGDGRLAKRRAFTAWSTQLLFAAAMQATLFVHRDDWAAVFAKRSDEEVFRETRKLYPIVAGILLCDANAALISGLVRGAGLQHLGGPINLAAFYLVGIPLAAILTFAHFGPRLGLRGLWMGIGGAFFSQAVGLGSIVAFSDFDALAERARIGESSANADALCAPLLDETAPQDAPFVIHTRPLPLHGSWGSSMYSPCSSLGRSFSQTSLARSVSRHNLSRMGSSANVLDIVEGGEP